MTGAIPLRHPVVAGAEHTVEGPARNGQFIPRIGAEDALDQRVDRRIGNARQIIGTFGARRLRGEERTHAIAGRGRHAEALDGHVEIEVFDPCTILDCVDDAQTGLDADGGEILDVRRMTRADHPSGSDRIFEALGKLDPLGQTPIVINLQGDFPTIQPDQIRAVLAPLQDPAVDIATLAAQIHTEEENTNPNVVKVVGSPLGGSRLRALYFTRATAPYGDGPRYHHIGLYAYRRPALVRFVGLPPSPLEQREKLEQLRALEAGMRIDVTVVETVPRGVDTAADLETARRILTS